MIDLILQFVTALTLDGSVSNQYGRIGIMVAKNGYIGKVYKKSPAAEAGLQKGDIVIAADGYPGTDYIDGTAGQDVQVTVKKKSNGRICIFIITRVPKREIHD